MILGIVTFTSSGGIVKPFDAVTSIRAWGVYTDLVVACTRVIQMTFVDVFLTGVPFPAFVTDTSGNVMTLPRSAPTAAGYPTVLSVEMLTTFLKQKFGYDFHDYFKERKISHIGPSYGDVFT